MEIIKNIKEDLKTSDGVLETPRIMPSLFEVDKRMSEFSEEMNKKINEIFLL